MRTKILLTLVILLVAALPATAQIQKGDWELSPMVGYAFPGAEFQNGFAGAFSVGYHFTKAWGLEFQLAYADSKVWDLNRDQYALRVSGLYNFSPDTKSVPYLKFGLGGVAMSPDSVGDVFSGDKQIHLGLGWRWFLSPRVALRAEALAAYTYDAKYGNQHDYMYVLERPGHVIPLPPKPPVYRWDTIYPVKNSFMNYEVMVGFSFFPKKRMMPALPPPPPPPPAPVEPAPAPAPVVEPPPPPPPPMMTVSIDEVVSHFITDKWALPKDGVSLLDGVVARLQQYPALKVTITGHTDSTGTAAWNATLSQRRADSVKKYLMEHGVSADRIVSATGMGPKDPAADNTTKEGRAKNRRAEVKSNTIQVPAK